LHSERLSIFGARVVTLALLSSFLCFAQQSGSAPNAVIGRLAGTWKENEAKGKLGSQGLRFRRNAKGDLEELRGAEARPLVQLVRFNVPAYVIDGNSSITWKQIDPSHFERQIFENGKLIATRKIQISTDGKTLSEATERTRTDGKAGVTTVTYTRLSGDAQGLVGVWKPRSYHSTAPAQVKYEAAGAGQLKVSDDLGVTYTMALDGKAVAVTGTSVISGTMIAGKQIDANTLEETRSREGVLTGRSITVVSSDGKVATVTSTNLGPNASAEPSIQVFERQ